MPTASGMSMESGDWDTIVRGSSVNMGKGSCHWTGIVGAKWGIIAFVGSAREQLEEGRE